MKYKEKLDEDTIKQAISIKLTRKKFERKKLVKFFLNSFFLIITNIFFLFISTEIFFFDHKFSQFIIMFFLIIINFTIQKKIIFV
jgi:hypothetical protein